MQKGFWLEKNKIKHIYPYLTQDLTSDVVVVGAGINGALTAYVLSKYGYNVVVIEKNIAGYKNSSMSSGCITDFIDEMYSKCRVNDNAIKKYSSLKARARSIFNAMIKEIETSYEVANYMYLDNRLFQKKNLSLEMNIRNEYKEATSFLAKDENINASHILQIKRGAYMVNSYELTQNILGYLKEKKNVKIFENTTMKAFNSYQDGVIIYTKNDFKIKTKSVVITTPLECLDFVTRNPKVQIEKRFSLVTNSAFKENLCAKVINDIPLYIRNDNNMLIVSGVDTKYISKMENEKYMESLKEENMRKMQNAILKLFPNFRVKESNIYCANVLKTKDMLPIISEMEEIPNVYLNVGSGSSAIMHSLIGADILKDAIKGYYPKEMNLFNLKRN